MKLWNCQKIQNILWKNHCQIHEVSVWTQYEHIIGWTWWTSCSSQCTGSLTSNMTPLRINIRPPCCSDVFSFAHAARWSRWGWGSYLHAPFSLRTYSQKHLVFLGFNLEVCHPVKVTIRSFKIKIWAPKKSSTKKILNALGKRRIFDLQ